MFRIWLPAGAPALAVLGGVPISEVLTRCDARFAAAWGHWFLSAQPDRPERAVLADPDAWYGGSPEVMGAAADAGYRTPIHTRDAVAIWRGWADDVRGHDIDSGHHRAEEAPEELAHTQVGFFTRT